MKADICGIGRGKGVCDKSLSNGQSSILCAVYTSRTIVVWTTPSILWTLLIPTNFVTENLYKKETGNSSRKTTGTEGKKVTHSSERSHLSLWRMKLGQHNRRNKSKQYMNRFITTPFYHGTLFSFVFGCVSFILSLLKSTRTLALGLGTREKDEVAYYCLFIAQLSRLFVLLDNRHLLSI